MKAIHYIFAAFTAALAVASCDTKIEPIAVQKPNLYTDAYYEKILYPSPIILPHRYTMYHLPS